MVNSPTVSVVVTTHDSAAYVADGLTSVLQQTYQDFEIVVVDDASGDSTCDEVNRALQGRCRYRLIQLDRNTGGPATPRNIGIQHALGRWVALLDSDDVWHPQKLELELESAGNARARFVSSEKRWFRNLGETAARAAERFSPTGHPQRQVTHAQLQRKNFLCTSSVLAERELFLRHPFNPDPAYRAIEDYRCWLDVHRESIQASPQILTPLVFYRVSCASISGSKLTMVRRHWRLYRDYFRGHPFGPLQVFASIGTYGFASIYRQLKYRCSRC